MTTTLIALAGYIALGAGAWLLSPWVGLVTVGLELIYISTLQQEPEK